MDRNDVKAGDFITCKSVGWTARVMVVDSWHLTYESSDGVLQMMEDTCFRNYDLKDYEPATEDAIAEWRESRKRTGYYTNSWD